MKTKLLLSVMVAAFAVSTFAGDVNLSPRAKDNQPKVIAVSINTQGGTVTYLTPASPLLRSPRVKDNQINVVKNAIDKNASPVASTVTAAFPRLLSPRAAGNQIAKASGVANERNPYLECQKTMTGSPKTVRACIESGAMPCMTIAPLK